MEHDTSHTEETAHRETAKTNTKIKTIKSGAMRKFAKWRYSRCSGSLLGVQAVACGPAADRHR